MNTRCLSSEKASKPKEKVILTLCIKYMFKYVKRNKLANRIFAQCDTENIKSEAVMKRCGMTFEGIARKAGENNIHPRCDFAHYSILEEEIEI